MKRVLVTGASGFIGRALCARMLAEGWQVRGIFRSAQKVVCRPSGVEAIEIESINAYTDWSDALVDVDTVIHLAARVHVMKDTSADPLTAFRRVNVAGTERLTRMAANAEVRRLVFLSSVGVNGNVTHGRPFTEEDNPHPNDPYAFSKFEAEQILQSTVTESKIEAIIIRSPLVYGPGNPGNFLRLLSLVAEGWPLPLASVTNRRSLIYVGNLVDAIVTCVFHPKAAGKTFLVSDGEDVSTPELIRRIGSALGRPSRLVPFPIPLMRLGGKLIRKTSEVDRLVGSLVVDSSRIRQELDWTPPYSMSQGLAETALWFNSLFQKAKGCDTQAAENSGEKCS